MEVVQCPFTGFAIENWFEIGIEQVTAGHTQHFIERTKQTGMPAGKSKTIKIIALEFDHLGRSFIPCLGCGDQIGAIEKQTSIEVARQLHQLLVSLIRSVCEPAQLQYTRYKIT